MVFDIIGFIIYCLFVKGIMFIENNIVFLYLLYTNQLEN